MTFNVTQKPQSTRLDDIVIDGGGTITSAAGGMWNKENSSRVCTSRL